MNLSYLIDLNKRKTLMHFVWIRLPSVHVHLSDHSFPYTEHKGLSYTVNQSIYR